MAKRIKKRGRSSSITKKLFHASELIDYGEYDEAARVLHSVLSRDPSSADAWDMLGHIYHELNDMVRLWQANEELMRLRPQDSLYVYNAAAASMATNRPFMTLEYVNIYLERWPDGEDMDAVLDLKDILEEVCSQIEADHPLEGGTRDDFAAFERIQLYFQLGDIEKGRALAEQMHRKLPNAAAPLNNLTLSYMMQGDLEDALKAANQVLEQEPENLHARCNLLQTLHRLGRVEEGQAVIKALKEETDPDQEKLAKLIETFATLDDHEAVVALYERSSLSDDEYMLPITLHLVATAFANLGNEKRAKNLWRYVLNRDPGLDVAEDNLETLEEPEHLRHAPWYFPFSHWVPDKWRAEMARVLASGSLDVKVAIPKIAKLVEQNPDLERIVQIMVAQGDPMASEVGRRIAMHLKRPWLREYAQGKDGSAGRRTMAAQAAAGAGMLPLGKPIAFYRDGEPTEVLLLNYEITGEPFGPMPSAKERRLMQQAHEALDSGRYHKALEIAQMGQAQYPNSQTFTNYLAGAYKMMGEHDKAREVIVYAAEKFPDYLFSRTQMARLCIEEDRLDEAQEWIDPLLERPKFHFSEFRALCMVQVELLIARGDATSARSWMSMWQQTDEDFPGMGYIENLIKEHGKRKK